MSTPHARPSIETLMAHADWVRALAARLVTDPARADDITQDTWVAALEHPPRDARNVKGWFSAIVRNTAREQSRSERRRTEREHTASRPESSVPSSAELVERANLQREIAAHVVALDEPYRTVVLLRWYEGLKPRDIAQRLGRPVDTITTQLARAHEQLRVKLDREHGDRSTWSALLFGIGRPERTAAAGVTAATLGGILMTTGWKVTIATIAALALALVVWRAEPWGRSDVLSRADAPVGPAVPVPAVSASESEGVAGASAGRTSVAAINRPDEVPAPRSDGLTLIESHGLVIDERGKPIPGLRLRAHNDGLPQVDAEGIYDHQGKLILNAADAADLRSHPESIDAFVLAHPTPGLREAVLRQDLSAEAITDGAGRYSVSVLGVKETSVDVKSTDPSWFIFLSAYEKPSHGLVWIAAPAVTLAGEIVDTDGNLLEASTAEFQLYLSKFRELTLDLDTRRSGSLTHERPDHGHFRFARAPRVAGWRIDFWCPGYETQHLAVPPADDEHMRIVLQRSHVTPKLSGVVEDVEGRPAADVLVAFGGASTHSEKDGRFVLASHDWRPISDLVAVKAGALPAILPEFGRQVATSSGDIAGIVLRMGGKPLSLRGRVLTATGEACVGWEVDVYDSTPGGAYAGSLEAISAGHAEHASPKTSANGSFVLEGLSARKYRVCALPPDRRLSLISDPVMPGENELVLSAPADAFRSRVSGRVVTKHGDPIAGVSVAYRGRTGENKEGWWYALFGKSVDTDALGRFQLDEVPRYNVTLVVGQYPLREIQIVLPPDAPGENLEVVAARFASLHVVVGESDPTDAIEVLDGAGEKLTIVDMGSADWTKSTRVARDEAGFPPCETDDTATTLVLLRQGVELRRVPISLTAGKPTLIRP